MLNPDLISLTTERLTLRPWQETDLEPFALLNQNSRVREFFPSCLTAEESHLEARWHARFIEEHGWGFWAVSLKEGPDFIGFIGLQYVGFEACFTPAVEIGWRLAVEHWGKGYATEGAKAALEFGFTHLQLPEIVSFTAAGNRRSRAVMEKIGMAHCPQLDFEHPRLEKGHPLRQHALYRLSQLEWQSLQK
jgi:RimJ/RimL family protein N-acetyltransferase